jgi:hypothetical protein
VITRCHCHRGSNEHNGEIVPEFKIDLDLYPDHRQLRALEIQSLLLPASLDEEPSGISASSNSWSRCEKSSSVCTDLLDAGRDACFMASWLKNLAKR